MIKTIKIDGQSFNLDDINCIYSGSNYMGVNIDANCEQAQEYGSIYSLNKSKHSPKEMGLTLAQNGIHNFASITQKGDLLVNLEKVSASSSQSSELNLSTLEKKGELSLSFSDGTAHVFQLFDSYLDAQSAKSALDSAISFYWKSSNSDDCLDFDGK